MNPFKVINTGCYSLFFALFFCNLISSQNFNGELKVSKKDSVEIRSLINLGEEIFYKFPDSAYINYKKALQLAIKVNSASFEAESLLYIGQYHNYNEEYKKSVEYYLKAIRVYESIGDKHGVADSYSCIGYSFSYLNSLDKSIEYYLKALKLYEELGNKLGIGDVYSGLGSLHYEQENYKRAIQYYSKAIELFKSADNKEGLLSNYINIGNAIADNGDLDKGIEYYKKSIDLTAELNDDEGLAINYMNMADCYLVKKEPQKALLYLEKSLNIIKKKNYKALYSIVYEFYSKAYLQLKNYNKAIYFSEKSLENIKNQSWIRPQYENYEYMSLAYSGLKDYKNAYKYSSLFKQISDSIFNLKKIEKLIKYDALVEVEAQEKAINLLTKNLELKKLESKNQSTLILVLSIFSFFFLVLIYVLAKQRKSRKKAFSLLEIEKKKAEESDHLKSAFLANMSHEIRTPMNAIMGFSNFLKNPDLVSEKRNHFIDIINVSGERLMAIINDIIDISKIESNQLKTDLKEFNVGVSLTELIEIQKKSNLLLMKKNIDLKLNIPANFKSILITTDENRLAQVLNNLINNAVKFTNEGYVEVGFKLIENSEKPFISFYVKDTGCGIPNNKFNAVFDRFSQAGEDDYKTGNGLGLSICKGLITILGGEIWLDSIENKGTTFNFTLPY